MKLKEALQYTHSRLDSAQINEVPLESELLVRHVFGLSAIEIAPQYDAPVSDNEVEILRSLISRRLNGEPLSYILGKREFYGLDFYVNPHVLIPRPETEHLVEKAIQLAKSIPSPIIADIGTGSGAIAIALAKHIEEAKILAVDISKKALATARSNAERHWCAGRISFLHGDLLEPLRHKPDIIVANLPYVKSAECNAGGEPLIALDGGTEGISVIMRLCQSLPSHIKPTSHVLLEIGMGQATRVTTALEELLPSRQTTLIKDLAGIDRIVWLRARNTHTKTHHGHL